MKILGETFLKSTSGKELGVKKNSSLPAQRKKRLVLSPIWKQIFIVISKNIGEGCHQINI